MRVLRLSMFCLVPAVLVVAVSVSAADEAPWLTGGWTVRRVVDAKVESTRYPGGEVAVCEFYTGGAVKPDGSDIRVAVRGQRIVKHRVLQIGPGDFVRLAFAAVPDVSRYYVYYGNPKAEAPEAWEPQRGLFLESRRWPGGPVDALEQVQAAWAEAPVLGADFVSHLWFGFSPFETAETPAIFHYVGWFVPPATGAYQIATSSRDGSWILVDGREVVAWPGSHGPVADARHAGSVDLTPEAHRIDYWNASQGGPMMTVAAWKPPNSDRFVPIPPEAFPPVSRAALVELDLPGKRMVADFFAEVAGETWWPDRYAVRMRFKNLSMGISARHEGRFEWDFGDGQTSTAAHPTHVYLAPGDYTVTLKAGRGSASSVFCSKVRVDRDPWKQAARKMDSVKTYAEEAARYDFQKLDLRNLLPAADLFRDQEMSEALVAAGTELLRRPGLSEGQVYHVGLPLGGHLRKIGRPEEAVAAYGRVEGRLESLAWRAEAAVEIGETLLRDLGRADEAGKEYQRALEAYAASGADGVLRRAHIGLGDIARRRGDGEKARQEYAAAAAIRVVDYPPGEAAVRVGVLARYVEDYTRQGQWEWAFKFLDDWTWEFPQDKLQGHWSFLKAGALAARGDAAAALREATDLLAANPASPYAVRLLVLAAQCHVALGQHERARRLLETAVADYPEDPYRDEARNRLAALGGPLPAKPPSKVP